MGRHRNIVRQQQLFAHRPDEGVYGDCHRTCIAMVLGLNKLEVPNFLNAETINDGYVFTKSVQDWLKERGLYEINVSLSGTVEVVSVLEMFESCNPGIPFILGCCGHSGNNHSVVCQKMEIFDPSDDRTKASDLGPMSAENYLVTFIVSSME